MDFRRGRRLRKNEAIRDMVAETTLELSDLIYPLFVVEGEGVKEEISSMKGQYRFSVDEVVKECRELYNLGIKSIILFGIPDSKDAHGTGAYDENGVVQKAIRAIKAKVPEMYVIADLCMCEYTDHGHCGILDDCGYVINDVTLEYLGLIATSQAKAGADMIAPSDMMDGRIKFIREALDLAGYEDLPIMAYSAKFASSYYGPFRDAADSAPSFGDRKSYQMDYRNSNEAVLEMEADIIEGADIIMIKPALAYLDIIRRAKDSFDYPICTYNVSGEYSMIKNAIDAGLVNESIIEETLIAMKRAGSNLIITYFAKDLALKWKAEK